MDECYIVSHWGLYRERQLSECLKSQNMELMEVESFSNLSNSKRVDWLGTSSANPASERIEEETS